SCSGRRKRWRFAAELRVGRTRACSKRIGMNGNSTGASAMGIASLGHAVFAATMVTLGILGLIQGGFTPTWTGVPKGVPAREVLAYLCACISLVTGIGLLWQRSAVVASRLLLTSFLVWLLLFSLPLVFRAP